jgi:hypothetical protein
VKIKKVTKIEDGKHDIYLGLLPVKLLSFRVTKFIVPWAYLAKKDTRASDAGVEIWDDESWAFADDYFRKHPEEFAHSFLPILIYLVFSRPGRAYTKIALKSIKMAANA